MFPDLQLYQARLDISIVECNRLWSILSTDEKSRANQLKREYLRHSFIAARGNLRLVLARSLNCEPTEIQFAYSDRGKPYLLSHQNPQNAQKVHFNLAHSQDLAIYIVSPDRQVGIDLELINPKIDVEGIARRYFSPSETNMITELGDRHRDLAIQYFYRAWTLKEAYAKATGQGITNLLNQIDITPLLDGTKESLQINNWQLQSIGSKFTTLNIGTNYAAALCFEGN